MRDYRRYASPEVRPSPKRAAATNRRKVEKPPRPPFPWKRLFRLVSKAGRFIALGGVLAVVVTGGLQLGKRYVLFPLERLEMRGEMTHLTREKILDLAGVREGAGLLSIPVRRVGENIARDPWVAAVSVRRYFPHTLVIDVRERKPLAIVNRGYLYYLDSNGEIFKPLYVGEPLDFPVVTGFGEQDPPPSPELLATTVSLIRQLQNSSVIPLDEVSEIHYDRGNGFTIYALHGGVPVRLGHDDFSAKLARLGRIYPQLQAGSSPPLFIDLDYPDRIIVRRS